MASITHDFKIIDSTTGLGLEMDSMTIVVRNRDNLVVQTFGPAVFGVLPGWLSIVAAGTDFTYRFTSGDITGDLPPDFAILAISGTTVTYGAPVSLSTIATLAADSLPVIPDGLEPYADLTYAAAYFGRRLGGAAWFALPDSIKLQALVTAADDLDSETYKGVKLVLPSVDSVQSSSSFFNQRQWPRLIPEFSFLVVTDTVTGTTDSIPTDIKDADCEQALYLARAIYQNHEDPNDRRDMHLSGVSGFQSQGIGETWPHEHIPNDRICAAARDRIRPYLLVGAPIGFYN